MALDGAGGLYGAGRWNSQGRPLVYCAETVPGVLAEVLVHLEIDPEDMPAYRLLGIDIKDDLPIREVAGLPIGWQNDNGVTRHIGDSWLRAGLSDAPALRVPSAIVPHTWNVLLNPLHPLLAGLTAASDDEFVFDPRLLS